MLPWKVFAIYGTEPSLQPGDGTLLAFRDSRGMAIASIAGMGASVITAYPLTFWLGVSGAALAFSVYFVVEAIGIVRASRQCFVRGRKLDGAVSP